MTIIFFIGGLIVLILGADLLVRGASRLAACHRFDHCRYWNFPARLLH
jgi:hypothetical protein